MDTKIDFKDPAYYENRELSWIKFDQRVLSEARDKSIPLLERLKFVSIASSNLDEFFMVRVASLKDMENAGYTKKDLAGLTPTQQLEAIHESTRKLVDQQYSMFNRSLLPIMKEKGIRLIGAYEDLNEEQSVYVDRYFAEQVYPVLTPMAVDASRPFPLIRNKSLNIAALIRRKDHGSRLLKTKGKKDELEFATVQVPSGLPRLVAIPSEKDERYTFLLLEQVIEKNLDKLFLNYDVVCAYPYRIMRNADLSFDEDEASDLLKEIQKQLSKRQWGQVIRLEVEDKVDKRLLKILEENFEIEEMNVYRINGPIDLTFLMKMHGLAAARICARSPMCPSAIPESRRERISSRRSRREIFSSIILTRLSIRWWISSSRLRRMRRCWPSSRPCTGSAEIPPIIAALAEAADNGKQVSVLVELKPVLMRSTTLSGRKNWNRQAVM